MSRRFVVLPTPDEVVEAAAARFVAVARNAIRRRGRFLVALSGGSTPRPVYRLLATTPHRDAVDWSRVEWFWADERAVPPDHPDCNFGLAWADLLTHLPGVRPSSIHRMHAEAVDLERAARNYQATLARVAGVAVDAPRPPRLDLVWLGMGRDGHTASLFPGMAALGERRRWVVASVASPTSSPPGQRMTLTFPILNAARAALLVVTGADKAAALRSVRTGSTTLPVGSVHAQSTLWLVDAAAAGEAA